VESVESASVAAIIPAFDAEAFVAEAIESVLGQTHAVRECIVVDDGSTDGTAAVVARFGDVAKIVRQPRSGVAAARNRGAAEAGSDLLAFLDADDVWHPKRVARGLRVLQQRRAQAALCASRVIGDDRAPMGRRIAMRPMEPSVESLLRWRGTVVSPSSNLLIERSMFEELGGFSPGLSTAADWELLVRIVARGGLAYVDEALVDYRWHGQNLTRDVAATERDLRRAYDMVLARHGADLSISRRQAYAGMHRMLAAANLRMGRRIPALMHGVRAAGRDPSVVPHVVRSRISRHH